MFIRSFIYSHRKSEFASKMKLGLDRDVATKIFTYKFADCEADANPFWIKALMPIGFVWFKNMLHFFI